MKTPLSTCAFAIAAVLAASAYADPPTSDAPPHGLMRADKDGDGKISRDEFQAAGKDRSAAWFDKLDTNKDGYLTQDELRQAHQAWRGHGGDMRQKMEERFKDADTNGDGQISLAEAQAKMPHLAEHFNDLDTNHDGQLSKDEMRHGGPHHGHGPQPEDAPKN